MSDRLEFAINWKYPRFSDRGNGGGIAVEVAAQKLFLRPNAAHPLDGSRESYGVYISNILSACRVDEEVEGFDDSLSHWKSIVPASYSRLNGDREPQYVLSDAAAFPAFCIFKNVCKMLEYIGKKHPDGEGNNVCSEAYEILREDVRTFSRSPEEYAQQIQSRIDEYVSLYNEFLMASAQTRGESYYALLLEVLKQYCKSSRLIADYLKKEHGRCFATFIENATHKKYISFSGFFDTFDPDILRWLGQPRSEFVRIAADICFLMNATFVPTTGEVRRYHLVPSPFGVLSGRSLSAVIAAGLPKDARRHYSCCERKIFAHFRDDTPDGSLYVKMKLCAECELGFAYQCRNGKKLRLHDGLEC